jgi:hypothetical protein
VCAAKLYSLSDEEKIKEIMHHTSFCIKMKSIFIHGIKDIPSCTNAHRCDGTRRQNSGCWLSG